MDNNSNSGESSAITSLVLGIVSCLLFPFSIFTGSLYLCVISALSGFIGVAAANAAKKRGYTGGVRIAGQVVSWIGGISSAVICWPALFIV